MEKEKKVSIVIPVFKVEAYIEECINSLLSQTYSYLEIILIDDGSPDKCPEICDMYAQRDNRIKVIHKKNGGAGSARNYGIDIITGEYLGFVDSDDIVKPNYVKRLVEELEKYQADIAVCGFEEFYKNGVIQHTFQDSANELSQIDFLRRFLSDWTCGLLWNKLFKIEIIGDIRFCEGHKIDDEFFTYRLVMNGKKVVLFDDVLYKYRMRASSVMNVSKRESILEDKVLYITKRFDEVTKQYPELLDDYIIDLLDSIIWLKREASYYKLGKKSIYKLFKEKIATVLFSDINIRRKLSFLCLFFFEKNKFEPKKVGNSFEFFE